MNKGVNNDWTSDRSPLFCALSVSSSVCMQYCPEDRLCWRVLCITCSRDESRRTAMCDPHDDNDVYFTVTAVVCFILTLATAALIVNKMAKKMKKWFSWFVFIQTLFSRAYS